jgi:erythromycin esterase-like protein
MKLGTAAWMTNEMLQLVEWLRIYNSENSQANWVLFYGIDMQWSTNIIRQLNTQYLKPEMLSSNSKRHLDSVSKFASTSYQNRDTLLMYELRELGYSHFDSIENYKRLVSLLGQYLALKQEVDEIKKSKLRDEFMAQNAIQLCKLVDKKGILWAHNEHITKTSNMLKYYPLGYYLSNEFGMKYYSIGLHTCQGKIGFYNKISRDVNYIDIPVDHSSSSLSFILSKVDFQAFFFDINDLSNKSTQNNKLLKREVRIRAATLYFDNKHNSYRVAVQNRKSILAKNYNAIVYINPSSGATPFKIKTD